MVILSKAKDLCTWLEPEAPPWLHKSDECFYLCLSAFLVLLSFEELSGFLSSFFVSFESFESLLPESEDGACDFLA